MSLERACVNCERCYHLSQRVYNNWQKTNTKTSQKEKSEDEIAEPYTEGLNKFALNIENDQIYTARNEAMKALEETINACTTVASSHGVFVSEEYGKTYGPKAEEALQACKLCDYSSPRIVETIENLSQLKKSD